MDFSGFIDWNHSKCSIKLNVYLKLPSLTDLTSSGFNLFQNLEHVSFQYVPNFRSEKWAQKLAALLYLFDSFWSLHLHDDTVAFPGWVEIVKPVYVVSEGSVISQYSFFQSLKSSFSLFIALLR